MTSRVRRAPLLLGAMFLAGSLLSACSDSQVLPADPPIAEPGYPQYTPPAPTGPHESPPQPPSPVSPSPTPSSPAPTPTSITTTPEAPARPDPALPTPTPSPTATPPSSPPDPAPAPDPIPTPSPSPAPTSELLTPRGASWLAVCGQPAPLLSPNPELTLTLNEFPATQFGGSLRANGHLATQIPTVDLTLTTEVVLLRDGAVVATHPGGGAASPELPLRPGEVLDVPVEHDLRTECPDVGASADRGGRAVDAGGEVADPPEEFAPQGVVPLPPGDYTVIVAVRLAAGLDAPGVIAMASGPLTITP